jgi:hypothetical protein
LCLGLLPPPPIPASDSTIDLMSNSNVGVWRLGHRDGAAIRTRGSRRSFGSPSSSSAAMATTTAPRLQSDHSNPNLATNNRKPSAVGVRFIASYDDTDDDGDDHKSRQLTSSSPDDVKGGQDGGLLSVITIPAADGQQQQLLEPPKSPAKKVSTLA